MKEILCATCQNTFLVYPYKLKEGKGKYCSRKCYEISKKGTVAWNKGLPATWAIGNKHRTGSKNPFLAELNRTRKSFKNHKWLADDVGYRGLHYWVERQLGRPKLCSNCGETNKKRFHWANVSKKYLRDIEDWIRLCPRCHKRFDVGIIEVSKHFK